MMKKWGLFLLGVLLSGCLGGRSQAPVLYSIESGALAPMSSSLTATVLVSEVQLPQYLDRPQMVLFDADKNQVFVLEKERWAEPLGDLIKRALTLDLARQFPKAFIKQNSVAQEKFDYYLFVDISDLKLTLNHRATMTGWWVVRSAKGKILLNEKIDLSRPLSNDYSDIAVQQGKMLEELAQQIGRHLKGLKSTN